MSRVELLLAQTDVAFTRLMARVDGLTDEEAFWQPVPDCWTIYQDDTGRWTYHYAVPDPKPAPITTIAWQLSHLGLTKLMYHEWAFGAAKLRFPELDVPHSVAQLNAVLETSQRQLRTTLASLSDEQLDEEVLTNWGARWEAWRIFTVMLDHDALHTGAIGQLRDDFYWRVKRPGSAGPPPVSKR